MSEGGFVVMRVIKVTTVLLMLSATLAAQGRVATTTSLTSSLNPAALGQTIILRATVTSSDGRPATGSVRFSGNLGSSIIASSILVNGVASLSVSTLPAGTHHITVHYSGDRFFRPSRSDQLDQVVLGGVPTTTVVTTSQTPTFFGQAVTFTATVSSSAGTPSGTAAFVIDGSIVAPNAPLVAGSATFTTDVLAVGSHSVAASYGGSAPFLPSGSPAITQVVSTGVAVPVISLSPATHDFGAVVVGHFSAVQGFLVTNTGTAPLGPLSSSNITFTGTNPGDFVINNTCPGPIAPGASCGVDVNFVPQAAGARTATFTVTASPGGTATATVSGIGLAAVPVISLSPATHDFGAVVVGHFSAVQGFLVTNTGTAPLGPLSSSNFTFTGANPGDFVVNNPCPSPIAPGASCGVDVNFVPQAAGSRTATFTVTASPGGTATATVSGIGLAAVPVISLSPATQDYGEVVVGHLSAPQGFIVTNTGTASLGPLLSSNFTFTGANPGDFVVNSTCPYPIAPGASCAVDVDFFPQAAGTRTATFTVTASPGGTATAAVSGIGLAAVPVISLSPATHDFGEVVVGHFSAVQGFIVTNTGTAPLGPLLDGNFTFTGATPGDFIINDTCQLIAPGASCLVDVNFVPQAAGARTATFTVTASPGGTATADLTGTGVVAAAVLTFTPASFDFGNRPVNLTSGWGVFFFTVTNTGSTATPPLDHVEFTGAAAADFFADAVDNHCTAVPLAPGASCTLSVGFIAHALGLRSATLTLSSSTGGVSGSAQVSGTGVPPTIFAVTPPTIDFGSVDLGQTSPVFTYTLTNTGPSPGGFFVTDSLIGVGEADYNQLTSECWGNPVNVGASCRFTVSFSPKGGGPRPATLTLVFQGGTATVNFTGFGTSPNALLTVSPDSQDFGLVFLGASSAIKTFTVTNVGHAISGSLVNFSFTGPGAYEFSFVDASNQCSGHALAPGASCTVGLIFTPQLSGGRAATFAISDGGVPGTAKVTGTGGSAAPLSLAIAPDTFRFGNVALGQSSAPATFTVTNPFPFRTGAINSFALTGVNTADYNVSQGTCAGAALDPGGTCTFSVTFAPQVGGGHPSTLTVTTTTGEAGATQLRGFGLAPTVLAVTPDSQDFGFVFVGASSPPVTFTVTNAGGGISAALDIAFTGTNASEFSYLDTSSCYHGIVLAPGASCTLNIFFFPQSYGRRSAHLVVSNLVENGGSTTVALTGGVTPGGVLTISPTSKDFGTIPVGNWTLPTEFTVTNVGSTIAILSGMVIVDPAGENYAFDLGSLCVNMPYLEVGASCSAFVFFRPQMTGPLPATLRLVYDRGTVTANLTGTGGPPATPHPTIGTGAMELTPFTAAQAAQDLLGVPTLSDARRAYLDLLGNHDGVYNLGDLIAFLDRNHIKLTPALLARPANTERVP